MVVKKRIMGIDPGYTNTGVFKGFIKLTPDDYSVQGSAVSLLRNKTKYNTRYKAQERMLKAEWMFEAIRESIQDFKPDYIVAELPTGGSQDASSANALATVTAILGALNADWGIETVTPTDVKKAVPNGNDKHDITQWAYDLFPELQWATGGKKKNELDVLTPTGHYLVNNMEHCGDAVATMYAGLAAQQFNAWHTSLIKAQDFVL